MKSKQDKTLALRDKNSAIKISFKVKFDDNPKINKIHRTNFANFHSNETNF